MTLCSISGVLSSADDLIIDNPQLWRCLAEFVHPLIKSGILYGSQLHSLCNGDDQFHLLTRELTAINSANELSSSVPDSTNLATVVWMRSLHQLRDQIGPMLLNADFPNDVIIRCIDVSLLSCFTCCLCSSNECSLLPLNYPCNYLLTV
jgi:hypothetical protein